jgi:FkbM family methyltransferase
VLAPFRAAGHFVANGVVLGNPRSAAQRIESVGGRPVDYLFFVESGLAGLLSPDNIYQFDREFRSNRVAYESILDRLADSESRDAFRAIINTRLHHDVGFLSKFENRQEEQYFEPFLGIDGGEAVFADVGSYDGATTRLFAERYPKYRHIHALEPSSTLAGQVRRNTEDLRDVTVHPFGAGDQDQTVSFSFAGSASRVTSDGDERIEIRRLDGLLDPQPTFIKMDIEGHEIPALLGASHLISRDRPILAVCCYHRVADLREIVQTVDRICGAYTLYLRHYTEGLDESVYFFVPQ